MSESRRATLLPGAGQTTVCATRPKKAPTAHPSTRWLGTDEKSTDMNDVKTQLICPDCGHPLVEIGYMANSYPGVYAWRSYSCGCFVTREESEASDE